ncbi:TonB-dependent receptor domain-containing protein [Lutimonas vermicola]|uniref:TonB-dependent receptor n=1 Tax=Lutimonas vermicola TaxID=414288 RepID=A0ABU9L3R0_9FLAO
MISYNATAQKQPLNISGTVMEEVNKNPIPFATVIVFDTDTNQSVTGTTTDEGGKFNITTDALNFYIEISFIGFETLKLTTFNIEKNQLDLGALYLIQVTEALDEVEIRAEKSNVEFRLDKRVFNVGKDISSTGMGALEVLNNVPSVTVSIEGEVSLRGKSGVQILIDGKPSILADDPSNTLGTITAEMIEKIEVITNPSAKYDAEGTAGILNIVLKKDEKKGLNGSISLNTGIPDNHSVGVSLNRRTEHFNLFAQLGVGYRSLPRDSKNSNQDRINNTTVNSEGTAYRNENFYNIILGTDYYINPLNVITLSGNFAYEIEDQPSTTDFSSFEPSSVLVSQWQRKESTEATNPKWQYELQYKREFKDNEDHTLLFSTQGRFFGKDQESEFVITPVFGDDDFNDQQTETQFQQADYTFKLDYNKPFSEKVNMELGSQYVINDVGNDYTVRDLIDGEWITNPDLTNNFEYNQKVFGIYGTGSYEGEAWGIKAGLRIEMTDLKTELTNTNEKNNQNYTDYFPSAHISYKFDKAISLAGGYSRRIFRPRLWDLNPFFNFRNNYNIRTGNPNLEPEYTDSYEITSIFAFNKISFNTGVYHLYTTDVVERITYFEDNVSITTPENIGTSNTTGMEVNFKYRPSKWLTFNGDFNYSYFIRNGEFEDQSFDFNGDKWSARLTGKFNLPADFELELTGNHQSGFQTVQSEVSALTFADLGVRKKIAKGKLVINFAIRDVFKSRISESVIDQPEYYLYTWNTRGRFFTLGLSYGFGKGEAMTYSGSRR